MFEIKFYSRAGQGAKSAGEFLVEAMLNKDKYFQTYPNYGPERTGSPMTAFVRFSDKPIKTYAPITEPDVVVIFDDTLLDSEDVTKGLKKNGIILINTKKDLKLKGNVHKIDATGIALKHLGRNIPNTTMLGALLKLSNAVDLDDLKEVIKNKFLKKIGEENTNKNLAAIKEGYESIK